MDRGRVPALDGVRGLAILLVVIGHIGLPGTFGAPPAGVTLFFVLSGYLISGLLISEVRRDGRVNLLAFWRRRAVRLAPALLALLVISTVLLNALGGSASYIGSGVLWSLSYVMNWACIHWDYHGVLSMTWTLAVEEQFYLVWPLLLPLILRTRRPLRWLLICAGASVALRLALYADGAWWWRVYAGTDTNAYALLLGAALAVLRSQGRLKVPSWTGPASLALLVGGVVLGAAVPALTALLIVLPVSALTGSVLIAAAADNPRWLRAPWLVYCGTVSYGWYLWHSPIAQTITQVHAGIVPGLVAAGVAFGLAVVSLRYIERPVLEWDRRRRQTTLKREISMSLFAASAKMQPTPMLATVNAFVDAVGADCGK